MPYTRDPVSQWFDDGARRLLARAYAKPGEWVSTRVANPSPQQMVQLAALGISPFAPDRPSTASAKGLDAHSRWCRAFIRALYYQHRWYSGRPGGGWRGKKRATPRQTGALEVRVGRMLPVRGVIPAGREVRVRLERGGQAARKAAERLPEARRIYDDEGAPGGRWSDPARRDW